MAFKTQKQLEDFLLKKCQGAIDQVYEEICRIIEECVDTFYNKEFQPEEYIRTYKLFNSLIKTGVRRDGNSYVAEVYFDVSKLNYQKGAVPLQHTPEHGIYGHATWDGQTVLDVAMTGDYGGLPHGGYESGTPIWTESMNRIGDIWNRLEQALKARGIPIKKG